ncbi:hypothetical protein JCM10512_1229 [Bacteroides reticulotermitis JCM 10512]|uniref:Uncharacterized protein n=1 Tax=Bacteroides reticulotermitis JCM 10512 TaxID=1445607 RepID=W4UP89_9BACE|nr:hypothetical protein JCM10512_1229 [Bacteroides reticulotermitis JCM 10512]
MARPHPVVRIGPVLAYRRRRRADHTYIAIDGLDKQIIFVASVESFKFQLCTWAFFYLFCPCKPLGYSAEVSRRKIINAIRISVCFQLFVYIAGYIQYTVNESNG